MHAYERDLHLILTSRPWSLYGSALMETALKPNLRPRRFPPPWTIDELDACFVVKDNAGQKLAYVYFEDEPGAGVRQPSCSAKMRRGGSSKFRLDSSDFSFY